MPLAIGRDRGARARAKEAFCSTVIKPLEAAARGCLQNAGHRATIGWNPVTSYPTVRTAPTRSEAALFRCCSYAS